LRDIVDKTAQSP